MARLLRFRREAPCPRCGGKGIVDRFDGTALEYARKRAGFGLRELARKLKVSAAHLSDVEHNRRNPSIELEGRIRAALAPIVEGK